MTLRWFFTKKSNKKGASLAQIKTTLIWLKWWLFKLLLSCKEWTRSKNMVELENDIFCGHEMSDSFLLSRMLDFTLWICDIWCHTIITVMSYFHFIQQNCRSIIFLCIIIINIYPCYYGYLKKVYGFSAHMYYWIRYILLGLLLLLQLLLWL